MSDFSESAITLGRVEAEFNYVVELLWDAGLRERTSEPVSYTHLTLPTIYSV